MTTSNEAIAAAREIDESNAGWFESHQSRQEAYASIIQKHYAAKDAEIAQLKIDIAEIRRQHQQEANEWKTDEEVTRERDQLKARVDELEYYFNMMDDTQAQIEIGKLMARVAELEKALKSNVEWHELNDEYGGYPESELCEINCKALTSTPSSSLTRLQELERKAKALDWLDMCYDWQFRPTPDNWLLKDAELTLLSAIENAMEKQK